MVSNWNVCRFSGGNLALDLVDTVLYLENIVRRTGRLTCAADVNCFAAAAARLCVGEMDAGGVSEMTDEGEFSEVLRLREAADGCFRRDAEMGPTGLRSSGELLQLWGLMVTTRDQRTLATQTELSVLQLMTESVRTIVRSCLIYQGLFLDNSRNRGRNWCDIAVRGNCQKSRLNYERKRRAAGLGSPAP